jgi:uncharacterized protein (TIGR02145 family)
MTNFIRRISFEVMLFIIIGMTVLQSCKKDEPVIPELTQISINREPNKTVYWVGDTLDLDRLRVELHTNDGESSYVSYSNFENKGITISLENGTILSLDNTEITITHIETNLNAKFSIQVHDTIVKDFEGNTYKVVRIGGKTWMGENLRSTYFFDGTPIPKIIDLNANSSTDDEWRNLGETDAAYCFYADESMNNQGALYTWYAAMGGNTAANYTTYYGTQGICPTGWHLPTDGEWFNLLNYIVNAGYSGSGSALKTTSGWYNDGNGIDAYNFSAYPTGFRNYNGGTFDQEGQKVSWWTSSEGQTNSNGFTGAYSWFLIYSNQLLNQGGGLYGNAKQSGFCVRCVKDN